MIVLATEARLIEPKCSTKDPGVQREADCMAFTLSAAVFVHL